MEEYIDDHLARVVGTPLLVVDEVVEIPFPGYRPGRKSPPNGGGEEPLMLSEFVIGPENRLLEVVVQSVLDQADNAYSPLILYGPSGSGKTHWAIGLAAAWKFSFRESPVVRTTAIDYARELAEAIQTKTVDEFGTQYREASLLIIEDVDHLAGKEAAQRELIFTLDELANSGGRVVMTAKSSPRQLVGIAPGLRSRMLQGLTVPIAMPGPNARLVIIQRLARLRGMQLSEEAARMLAAGLSVTVPELLGAMTQLSMAGRVQGRPVDGEAVRRHFSDRNGVLRPSLHDIALLTAQYFSLKLTDLRSPSRRRAVVTARGVAMYLARNLTASSLKQIGQYFGGRDHTTVSHGCRTTEMRLQSEPDVRHAVLKLQERFQKT